jgi:transposase
MYIIKTISKNKNNSTEKYYTYRMMESLRVGPKVKKITLLNLGSSFDIAQDEWATLAKRVDDIIHQRACLFELDAPLEALAQEYGRKIIASKAKRALEEEGDSNNSEDADNTHTGYKEIDTNTLKNIHPKTVGVEHIIYETICELGLPEKFKVLGFTPGQINAAIGTLTAKCANPSSEAAAYRWLCDQSALDELLGCDFTQISSNAIYRISDKLYKHKEELEAHLYTTQKKLFDYEETITLYDLTNTYFEGSAKGISKAARGRSKEKRSDAPLVTLAVMLDSSGFVRKSEIYAGNIAEPSTFKEMLDKLRANKGDTDLLSTAQRPLIVMDAGIASQENIDYLIENEYEYIVVSRKRDKQFDESGATAVKLNNKEEVIVKAQKVINQETGEVELYVHSQARALKEKAMQARVSDLFIEKLNYFKEGLSIKRRTKVYETVIESIGRLKEKYPAIAQHYAISVTKDPIGPNAIDVSWKEKPSLNKKSEANGVYCLRSNNTTMDEETLWKTYTTLTDLEAVFRSLKSELGLRPIFHQKQSRVDGHLFITLLAYSIIHTIRHRLKKRDIHYSWSSIREILKGRVRITTSAQCKDGTVMYIRQSSQSNEEQKRIYEALCIDPQAGKRSEVYV